MTTPIDAEVRRLHAQLVGMHIPDMTEVELGRDFDALTDDGRAWLVAEAQKRLEATR